MKKLSKIALLATFFIGSFAPAWGQASTQGKEFWVSSTIVCSPAKNKGIEPYIAVSAEKACTVTIQGGIGNAINITQNVTAGSWNEFGNVNKEYDNVTPYYNNDPSQGPINVQMDASKWYPINTKEPATVCNLAGQKFMYGLHITATENISVYVILSGESSMDASNILPLTALGAEYYVQDYTPEAHNGDSWSTNEGNMVTMTTILGTENGTIVDIVPNGDTYDNHQSGISYNITLNQGEVYYLISKKMQQLAGTHIMARNDQKIAIYTGLPLTRLPNEITARDALFEQPMPVQYWGTQFIATRSLEKNGNLIGITATQPRTEIRVDKTLQATIGAGETYYVMLQNEGDPQSNKPGTSHVDQVITGDAIYIETSCPCAVYSYDTGNRFVGKGKDASGNVIDEVDGKKGDPSSVWVSPIQQKINKITFGTCYTQKTKDHFLNVVTETATCNNTTLTAIFGANTIDKTNLLNWIPVPGNPKYSYARAKIGNLTTKDYSVFRLENKQGFIATVYGNGENESYAYSAGSAAVEQGVNVNGETFVDGYRSDSRFCINSDLSFEAVGGADEVLRVDWDFGDGTTDITEGEDAQKTTHMYTSKGWYDVSAVLYGRQVCTNEPEQLIGEISFAFRVIEPDTLLRVIALCADEVESYHFDEVPNSETFKMRDPNVDEIITRDISSSEECSNVYRLTIHAIAKREEIVDLDEVYTIDQRRDGAWIPADGYNVPDAEHPQPEWVTTSGDYERRYLRSGTTCDSTVTYHVTILKCLDMLIVNDSAAQHVCYGETLDIPYSHNRDGKAGNAFMLINNKKYSVSIIEGEQGERTTGVISLPLDEFKPGRYTAKIQVEDINCESTYESPMLDIAVLYPADIFAFKFNNVLAVYSKGHGGNTEYEFLSYQWYHNGEPIDAFDNPTAITSVFHTAETFIPGDTYYVLLTDKNTSLPSCEFTVPEDIDNYEPEVEEPAAMKALINRRLYIRKGDLIYDIYGQRVQ